MGHFHTRESNLIVADLRVLTNRHCLKPTEERCIRRGPTHHCFLQYSFSKSRPPKTSNADAIAFRANTSNPPSIRRLGRPASATACCCSRTLLRVFGELAAIFKIPFQSRGNTR